MMWACADRLTMAAAMHQSLESRGALENRDRAMNRRTTRDEGMTMVKTQVTIIQTWPELTMGMDS